MSYCCAYLQTYAAAAFIYSFAGSFHLSKRIINKTKFMPIAYAISRSPLEFLKSRFALFGATRSSAGAVHKDTMEFACKTFVM